jgi:dTDP-D-glucose 4,6-dehydratase
MYTVITGGAGFIGSHLTDHLLAAGDTVSVIDDFSTGSRANLEHHLGGDPNLQVFQGSILDRPLVNQVVAGADRVFYPAEAKIDRDTLIVSSPKVREPVAVRYAWFNAPEANLYNGAGLPAVPFRSDTW